MKIFLLALFVNAGFLRSMCFASNLFEIKSQQEEPTARYFLKWPSESLKTNVNKLNLKPPVLYTRNRPLYFTSDWFVEKIPKLSKLQWNNPSGLGNHPSIVSDASSMTDSTARIPVQSKIYSVVPNIPLNVVPTIVPTDVSPLKPPSERKPLKLETSGSNSLFVHPSKSIGNDLMGFEINLPMEPKWPG